MKRKKITRAYKIGHNDGMMAVNKNPYAEGSVQYADYERGFGEGVDFAEGRAIFLDCGDKKP